MKGETTTVRCDMLTRKRLRVIAAARDITIQELLRTLAEVAWESAFTHSKRAEGEL